MAFKNSKSNGNKPSTASLINKHITQKLTPIFQEYSNHIFPFTDNYFENLCSTFKTKGLEIIRNEESREYLDEMLISVEFRRYVEMQHKLCLHMALNEPRIQTNIQIEEENVALQYRRYDKSKHYCIDGFPKEHLPCVIVLPPPKRNQYIYQGIKAAVAILNDPDETTLQLIEEYEKNQPENKKTKNSNSMNDEVFKQKLQKKSENTIEAKIEDKSNTAEKKNEEESNQKDHTVLKQTESKEITETKTCNLQGESKAASNLEISSSKSEENIEREAGVGVGGERNSEEKKKSVKMKEEIEKECVLEREVIKEIKDFMNSGTNRPISMKSDVRDIKLPWTNSRETQRRNLNMENRLQYSNTLFSSSHLKPHISGYQTERNLSHPTHIHQLHQQIQHSFNKSHNSNVHYHYNQITRNAQTHHSL